MLMKFIGAFAVSASSYLLCSYVKENLKEKMAQEDSFSELLLHIKNMISAGNMPLDEIYASFHNEALEKTGFCKTLKSGGVSTLYDSLEDNKKLSCDKRVYELMLQFSKNIGLCFSPEQGVFLCEKYISLIQSEVSSFRKDDIKKVQLYGKLAFLIAAAVFLMCI